MQVEAKCDALKKTTLAGDLEFKWAGTPRALGPTLTLPAWPSRDGGGVGGS